MNESTIRPISIIVVFALGITASVGLSWSAEQPEKTVPEPAFITSVTISNGITKTSYLPPRRPGETPYFCNLRIADAHAEKNVGGAEMFLFTGEKDSTTTAVGDYTFNFAVDINSEGDTAFATVEIIRGTEISSRQQIMVQLLQTSRDTDR